VDNPIPQPDRLLPGHVREFVFDLSRELSGGLAEHGEVPWQGVATLAVAFQLADGDACGQMAACSAASIISVSRRMSRCIDRPSLGQD
jgi:hypothetical protein